MHTQFAHIEPFGCDKPQTRRGHERRLALLLSGSELFLKYGYDAVSLDDIVNHAGGSKASIYKYFALYTTNFTEPLSYQDSAFLKLPKFP